MRRGDHVGEPAEHPRRRHRIGPEHDEREQVDRDQRVAQRPVERRAATTAARAPRRHDEVGVVVVIGDGEPEACGEEPANGRASARGRCRSAARGSGCRGRGERGPTRSGARLLIASYTHASHTISSASSHQRVRTRRSRLRRRVELARRRAETAVDKPSMLAPRSDARPPPQAARDVRGRNAAVLPGAPSDAEQRLGGVGLEPARAHASITAAARRPSAARSRARSSRRRRAAAARPLAGALGEQRGDRVGGRARLPVASPVAPQQRAPAAAARERQRGGVEHPVGRAVEQGATPVASAIASSRAREVLAHRPAARRSRLRWRSQCSADPVPGGEDLAGERRVAPDLLADEEERRGAPVRGRARRARRGCPRDAARRRRSARSRGRSRCGPRRRAAGAAAGHAAASAREHVGRAPPAASPASATGDRRGADAMIVAGHGRTRAGNRGRGRRVDALQPRGRAAGDGRQGGARRGTPAPGAGVAARAPRALAARHRALDPRLAAAGCWR